MLYYILLHSITLHFSRPGSFGGCYNTGFVQNTVINWVNSKIGACPGGRFSGGVWHNVTVYVRGDDVSIELDGKHLVTTKAHYPNRYESRDLFRAVNPRIGIPLEHVPP